MGSHEDRMFWMKRHYLVTLVFVFFISESVAVCLNVLVQLYVQVCLCIQNDAEELLVVLNIVIS